MSDPFDVFLDLQTILVTYYLVDYIMKVLIHVIQIPPRYTKSLEIPEKVKHMYM